MRTRRVGPHAAVAAGLTALLAGCVGSVAVVARPPWLEDRSLELRDEELRITVRERVVAVDALFLFVPRGEPRDRRMTFPIAAPAGPASGFAATIERPGAAPFPLPVQRSSPGALPTGDADDTWDIFVPAIALDGIARLRVRYHQRRRCRFAYVLRTGAYWAGPLGRLVVEVRGPVERARVEGRPPGGRGAGVLRWVLRDVEPSSGVVMDTCAGQSSRASLRR